MIDPAKAGQTTEEAIETLRWMQTSCADAGDKGSADTIGGEIDALLDQMNNR